MTYTPYTWDSNLFDKSDYENVCNDKIELFLKQTESNIFMKNLKSIKVKLKLKKKQKIIKNNNINFDYTYEINSNTNQDN